MSPNPYIPSTIAPMQVPLATVITEDAFTFLFRPGSPLQKIPHSQLLAKLISTDLVKVSKALLDADLAWVADKVALVHNDPTALLNGWYRKTGASGAGAWVQFEALALAVRDAAAASAADAFAYGVHLVTDWPGGEFTLEDADGLVIETLTPDGGKYVPALYRPGPLAGYADKTDVWAELTAMQATLAGASEVLIGANTAALRRAVRDYGYFPQPTFRLAANDVPTITLGAANAASAIPTPASAAMSDARFTYPGGVPRLFTATYPGNTAYISRGGYYGRDAGDTGNVYASGYFVAEFNYTGTNAEPILLGNGNGGVNVRVLVNGTEAGTVTVPNNTGSFYRLLLQFPTSATRRITLITGGVPFCGVSYDATGVLASVNRTYPVATLVGDSFVEGAGSVGYGEAVVMARALGFNAALAGAGSTGMISPGGLNTAGGQKVRFTDTTRLLDLTLAGVTSAHSGAAVAPAIGFVFGTINDNGQAPGAFGATLQEAITNRSFAMIDAWVAANPGKPLVFFGPTWPSGSPVLDIYRIRDGIQEAAWAAVQSNVWFIDRLAPGPILRSGVYTGGTDQASLYTSGDATHPTDAGHRLDGLWMAQQLRPLILSQLG